METVRYSVARLCSFTVKTLPKRKRKELWYMTTTYGARFINGYCSGEVVWCGVWVSQADGDGDVGRVFFLSHINAGFIFFHVIFSMLFFSFYFFFVLFFFILFFFSFYFFSFYFFSFYFFSFYFFSFYFFSFLFFFIIVIRISELSYKALQQETVYVATRKRIYLGFATISKDVCMIHLHTSGPISEVVVFER